MADVTVMTLAFAGGVRAHVFVSWLHPFKEHRFVVVGERQMAIVDDTAPWPEKLVLYPHRVDWTDGRVPVARRAEAVPVALVEGEPLRLECEHFLARIADRRTPLTDAASGVAVVRLLAVGERSLGAGGAPVRLEPEPLIHPTATVDPGAVIGEGTRVWHYSHVMGTAAVGRDGMLGQNTFVGDGVRIGDRVRIQNNVSVYAGVELEDDVFCGPGAVFTNVRSPRADINRAGAFEATLVRRGATLGANCTIVCGTTVGRWAFVAAGAVVTADVPDHALVAGVPARITGWRCQCGEALARGACAACGRTYPTDAAGAVLAGG